MRRLWTFFLAAVLSLVAVPMSGSDVDSLRINVELRDNGSAIVTETWHIDVSDDITEWYLVADNMGQMTIEDLAVSDETLGDYLNEGEWDVDRSRALKAGRCGLVTKSNGLRSAGAWEVPAGTPTPSAIFSPALSRVMRTWTDSTTCS